MSCSSRYGHGVASSTRSRLLSWASPGRTAGSVSIEATLMLPLFLVTVFVILQASLWVYSSATAQAAAQDGARAATAYLGSIDEGIQTTYSIMQARATGEGWIVTATPEGRLLTITVTGHAPSILPGLELTVRESASLPWEAP